MADTEFFSQPNADFMGLSDEQVSAHVPIGAESLNLPSPPSSIGQTIPWVALNQAEGSFTSDEETAVESWLFNHIESLAFPAIPLPTHSEGTTSQSSAKSMSLRDELLGQFDVVGLDLSSSNEMALSVAMQNETTSPFSLGFFTVGATGEVTVDYLFDGGFYRGELAIFSLEGMEHLSPATPEFNQIAAERALSNSVLGHIVISDRTEGARFSGELGEPDQNSGPYPGARTFSMTPGDEFGFMLVPNGRVQEVFDNPSIGGRKKPVFSLVAVDNNNNTLPGGQLVNITSNGDIYAIEDKDINNDPDFDYNDIIFQVLGATGETSSIEDFIDPSLDWRATDLGQQIIALSNEQETGILLQEGVDFSPSYISELVIPGQPSVLTFMFNPNFDDASTGEMNDAFEVALLDSQGRSLVHTIGAGKDAFLNLTEGLPTALGAGTTFDGQTVTLDISDITPGTEATLAFRLVNNDDDTETEVRIQAMELLPGEDNSTLSIVPSPIVPPASSVVDASQLEDVSDWLTATYGRTSFNEQTAELSVEVAASNTASYGVRDSLVMVVGNISDPQVQVLNGDGILPDGRVYFDLSDTLGDGVLSSGEMGAFREVIFSNPAQVQFDYEVSFLSALNQAPEFISDPNVEALAGKAYTYDADAIDADGDALTYSLLGGPEGLTVDSTTGEIAWNPAATDVGSHQVVVQVEDGQGGVAEQVYTLTVRDTVANRPPVITTLPGVDAAVGEDYTYDVDAIDADGDSLTYSILSGPTGLEIDAQTGLISWTPTADQVGEFEVTVEVNDAQGGTANQTYSIVVGGTAGNNAPIFVSTPITQFQLPGLGNPADGEVDPNGLDLDLLLGETVTESVSLTLPNTGITTGFADVVFVVDESGSMAGEQAWLSEMVLDLDAALQEVGISSNRYALTGFGSFGGPRLFNVERAGEPPLNLSIFSESNQLIVRDKRFGDLFEPFETVLLNDGTYAVVLSSSSTTNQPVSYRFQVSDPAATAPDLSDLSGITTVSSQTALASIEAATLPVALNEPSSEAAAQPELRLESQPVLPTAPDPSAPLQVEPLETAPITENEELEPLALTTPVEPTVALSEPSPDATIQSSLQPSNATLDNTLIFGETITGRIDVVGEEDVYTFTATAGQQLYFDGFSNTSRFIDADLFTPSGNHLLYRQDTNGNRGILTAPQTGTYRLVIDGNGAIGDYSFRLLDVAAASTSLPLDAPVNGTLTPGVSTQFYRFEGTAGQRVLIRRLNNPSGVSYRLQSASGNSLSLSSAPSRLPINDTYFLVVEGSNDAESVNFSFNLTTPDRTTAPLTLGETITSRIDEIGEEDVYTFTATAGQKLYFDGISSTSGNIEAFLSTPSGSNLFSWRGQDISRNFGPITAPETGTYQLVVNGSNAVTGDYAFRLLDVVAASTPMSLDAPVSGTLDSGVESQIYRFEGTAGQRVFLRRFNNISGTDYRLVSASGRIVSGITSASPQLLPETDTYFLIVTGPITTEPVDFSFNITTPDRTTAPLTLGETITSRIDEIGEEDIYAFTATAGQQLYFDGISSTSGNIEAFLLTPNGSNIFPRRGQDVSRDLNPITVPQTGTYQLVVNGSNAVTGDYSWRLLNIADAPLITLGTEIEGSLDDGRTVDIYRLEGSASQSLIFTAPEDVLFGSADELSGATQYLVAGGLIEDGYQAINTALEGLSFRPGAAVSVVLITDEDRDVVDSSLSFGSIQNALNANDVQLDTIVSNTFRDGNSNVVLGIDANNTGYQADGAGGFITRSGVVANNGGSKTDYVDLAQSVGGTAWDLNQLRAGGLTAQSFTEAFVDIKTQEILEQFPIDLVASDPDVQFTNLTGPITGLASGDTATFSAEFTGDGIARNFDLLFVRPETGLVLGSIPVTVNNDYFYLAQAIDPDADSITYSLLSAPTGATIDAQTGEIHWEPTTAGTYDFVVQADDGRGGLTTQAYAVTTTTGNNNQGPAITSTAPTQAGAENEFAYQVTATDADGDALSYYLSQAPEGLAIDRTTGEIRWTPTASQVGTQTVDVRVLDGRGGEANQSFEVTVDPAPINRAPDINSAPVTSAVANQPYRYDITATDPDNNPLQFDLSLQPEGMTIDPATGTILWQPTTDQLGDNTVIVRVQDGQGGVDLQSFNLSVVADNSAPVITSTAIDTATAGSPYEYRLQAQDADGEVVSYRLDNAPAGMAIDQTTGILSWTPAVSQLGATSVTVAALDDQGAETTQTYSLNVVETAANTAPEILSAPRTQVRVETPYLYQLNASDPNGDPLSYSVINGPDGLTIDDNGLVTWTPQTNQLGDQTVTLEVNDGRGGTVQQTFTLTVGNESSNSAPTITSSPDRLAATVNTPYRYDATATDPDRDVVLWRLIEAPTGLSLDAVNGTLRWQPSADQLGNHTITFQAVDALGAFTEQSFDLTVRGTNLAPLITSIPITEAAAGQAYTYDLQATDAEGDALTYTLVQGPAGMTIDETTGRLEWQPTAVGFADVVVAVTDAQGAGTTQTYQIAVAATAPNLAPAITSRPSGFASVGSDYTYQVVGNDPNGDTLTYQLLQGPTGMTLDPDSGLLSWQPDATGSVTVVVGAVDPDGLGGAQRFTLQVVAANDAPVVTSSPVTTALTGSSYRYDLQAQDPNGDALSYELLSGPEGMTVDAFGRVRWTPTEVGSTAVEIAVRDVYGATTTQAFTVTAGADNVAPEVAVFPSLFPADVGQTVSVFVSATDNVGVVSRTLTFDGNPVPLINGAYTFTADQTGDFTAVATATDAAGNTTQSQTTVQVRDFSNTGVAPTVSLASLAGQVLTSPTDIIGTVTDDNLVNYTLGLATLGSDDFREIYRSTDTVSNGVLGQLDTALFQNDAYTLRLTAEDANGNIVFVDETVNIAGDLKLGNFTLSFTDMQLPVSGIPIAVTRTYDSLNANETDDFGFGWRLEFRDTDLRTSLGRDEQFEQFGIRSQAFDDQTRVYLTLPGGQRQGFTFAPQRDPVSNNFPPIAGGDPTLYRPAFEADDGVTSTLSVRYDGFLLRGNDGSFGGLQGSPFNPEDPLFGGVYVLTTQEGIEYEIDAASGDLLTAKDLNGNTLTFDDSGIYSDSGTQVTFGRDAQGRITSVTDPEGNQVSYGYDANGDLVSVTDREGHTTQFDYNDDFAHYLDEVIDPLGRSGVKSEYDDQGRLTKLLDVNGEEVELVYDPENSTQTVLDVFGNPTTYVYDSRGNVLTEIDAVGQVTQRSYDDDNNVLTETVITAESGPEGWTTTYTYDDQRNQTSRTDALGNTEYYTYNSRGQLLSNTDALGNTTTYSFDSRGNVLSKTEADGSITTYTYDFFGNALSIQAGSDDLTQYEYDQFGNRTRKIDALGNETNSTYDAFGNQLSETMTLTTPNGVRTLTTTRTYDGNNNQTSVLDAEGNLTQFEYDANGNQTAIIDALGRRTVMRYDDKNNLIETILPDDTPNDLSDNPRLGSSFDAAGKRTAITDADGRTTTYSFDPLERPTGMVLTDDTPNNPDDNPRIVVEYDQAGRMSALVSESGARTEYEYDAVGRIIGSQTIQAGQPQATSSTFDANGNELTRTDALGRTTEFVHDAQDQLIETIYPDGTRTQTSYDDAGNVIASTDALGRTTQFEYDALDRLTAVIDSNGQTTGYTYDEMGNLVEQTDALGQITRFEYDGLGRMTATVRPLGQRSETEYDAVGRITQTTDFNGEVITYAYNDLNQLTSKTLVNDGVTVDYSYSDGGRRESVTDARGTTLYDYDDQGRLISRTEPDSTSVAYTYTQGGQVETITTPSGVTTYQYTDLNQLATVIDADGDTTTYRYDAVGNLTQTIRPNGTVQTYEYDDLNRLTYLESKDSSDTVIASYRYRYDAVGNKTSVEENTGRRVEYRYDNLHRLVEETITDPVEGNRTITYSFDAVGNRLSKDDSLDGLTTYTYDDNDRLLTETTNGVTTTYSYDDNGNLISEISPDQQTTYLWSAENRLMGAEITDANGTQVIEYAYDADGVRVAKTVDGDETRYLIDANRQYAQVLEEYDASTGTEVTYIYGNELISQSRGDADSVYLYDGHSGTRQLTDETGAVTDSYLYDAYGNVLKRIGDTENDYLYRGEQSDSETGLQYLRARYNDFETGRFISTDPFEGMADTPMSVHRYLYGYNNPVQYSDPSGMISITADSTGSSVLQGILNSINWAKWIPGISQGIGIGLAAYGNFRGNLREWSGTAVGGTPFGLPLSQLPVGIPFDPSFTSLLVEASTTVSNAGGTSENTYRWIVGNFNIGVSSPDLTATLSIPAPTNPIDKDEFRAYTKYSYGANPVLLTPFTLGVNAGVNLLPGMDINSSFKAFLMGVGFAGIASSRANLPNVSAAISGGFSFLISSGRDSQAIALTPES
jgi:RHS repeat-associated protein